VQRLKAAFQDIQGFQSFIHGGGGDSLF
jgi:hypothetical protein